MFNLPKSISRRIEKFLTSFLLSGENKSQYMAKIKWKELRVPKDEGGILIIIVWHIQPYFYHEPHLEHMFKERILMDNLDTHSDAQRWELLVKSQYLPIAHGTGRKCSNLAMWLGFMTRIKVGFQIQNLHSCHSSNVDDIYTISVGKINHNIYTKGVSLLNIWHIYKI